MSERVEHGEVDVSFPHPSQRGLHKFSRTAPPPSLGPPHPPRQHTLVRGPDVGFSPGRSTPPPSTPRSRPKPWPPPAPQLPGPPHGTRAAPNLSSGLADVRILVHEPSTAQKPNENTTASG